MSSPQNILNYYANSNTGFIHANGKAATQLLVDLLECKPGQKILEFGFGTGSTLALLAAEFPQSHFYGVDQSELMYHKTLQRLAFCGLGKSVSVEVIKPPFNTHFEDNFFDSIYVESVLGIQEDNNLEIILSELKRVLKPNGKFILNETIWLDSVSTKEITDINQKCKSMFGIIQASGKYPYRKDWLTLLHHNAFEITENFTLDETTIRQSTGSLSNFRSDIFTYLGKIKSLLSSAYRKESRIYKHQMEALFEGKGQMMSGVIVSALNKK